MLWPPYSRMAASAAWKEEGTRSKTAALSATQVLQGVKNIYSHTNSSVGNTYKKKQSSLLSINGHGTQDGAGSSYNTPTSCKQWVSSKLDKAGVHTQSTDPSIPACSV